MSVSSIIDQRIEYDPFPLCPACGCTSASMRFTTYKHLRGGDGRLNVDRVVLGEATDPHLIVSCSRCGLDREMETYL